MRIVITLLLLSTCFALYGQNDPPARITGITLATYSHMKMKDFYEKVFDIRFTKRAVQGYTLYNGSLGQVNFELCPAELAGNNTTQNRHQLTVDTEDLSRTIDLVRAQGGSVENEIAMYEGRLMAVIADPDQNSIILRQRSMITPRAYFKATGVEPFWSLEINPDMLRFTSLSDDYGLFTAPHVDPERAMDAPVRMYRASGDKGMLKVEIIKGECVNSMSGKSSPYKVRVELKKGTGSNVKELEGCGEYLPDKRLNGVWVLDSLNGKKVVSGDYAQEVPNLEINVIEKSFAGFAGCNRMSGGIFSEENTLRFTRIVTTRMSCRYQNKETALLEALRNVTTFKIYQNHLYLSNPNGSNLVFRKLEE